LNSGALVCSTKGYGGGSAKKNVARILSDAPEAISTHMNRSFAERRYLPSTGMDRAEWEIILEQLIRVSYIVKEEPVSKGGD
jgi:hypothetical protein